MRRILAEIRKAIRDEEVSDPERILVKCLTEDASRTVRELLPHRKKFTEDQVWDSYLTMFIYETAKSDLRFEEQPHQSFHLRERLRNPPRPGPKYVMNHAQVDEMRTKRNEGWSLRKLAQEFGVHYSTIWRNL